MRVPGAEYLYVIMHNAETGTGNGLTLDVGTESGGYLSIAAIQLEGINGETITFEGTIDLSTWYSIPFTNLTSGTAAATATADGIYRATVMGLLKVRARISTGGSGSVTAIGVATA